MSHDAFISHSSQDKATADAICAALEAEKIRCWIAPRDIQPGKVWSEALIDAISSSRVMVVVFSGSANQSPQVMREVERAVSKGVPVVPLRIEDVTPSKSLEYFLSTPHWLDALTPPLENHISKLTKSVKALLSAPLSSKLQRDATQPPLQPRAPAADAQEGVDAPPDQWFSQGSGRSWFNKLLKFLTGE